MTTFHVLPAQESAHNDRRGSVHSKDHFDLRGCRRSDCEDDSMVSNQEIRSALVNNPRTPTPLALKLLPTLPEPEIRHIAKSTGVSQALEQAALRIVIGRG